jgi:hypothetical protein
LRPRPAIHANFAATAALPTSNEHGTARAIEIGLGEIKRLTDPQASSEKDDNECAQPGAVGVVARGTHHRDDLLDRRGIGRVAQTFVPATDPRESPASSPATSDDQQRRTGRIPSCPPSGAVANPAPSSAP